MDDINIDNIKETIYLIRGFKVMLDFDLASLYGVETKVLKQSVRRNIERFPQDFMFTLTEQEVREMRSQIVTSSLKSLNRSAPMAFTEQGVAMLSSVLNSKRAIDVNISIIRTFTQLRTFTLKNDELTKKLEQLEKNSGLKFLQYDEQFRVIMDLIQNLNSSDGEENTRKIGFNTNQ